LFLSEIMFLKQDSKMDTVLPVKKVLTVEDGLETPLTGVAIFLLRTSTKRTLGEETFQREIMCGMLNAQVRPKKANFKYFKISIL